MFTHLINFYEDQTPAGRAILITILLHFNENGQTYTYKKTCLFLAQYAISFWTLISQDVRELISIQIISLVYCLKNEISMVIQQLCNFS